MAKQAHNKRSFKDFLQIAEPQYPSLEFIEDEKYKKGRVTAYCSIHDHTFDARVDSFISGLSGCTHCGSSIAYLKSAQVKSSEYITPETPMFVYVIKLSKAQEKEVYWKIGISRSLENRLFGFGEDVFVEVLRQEQLPLYRALYLEFFWHRQNATIKGRPDTKWIKTGNTELFLEEPDLSLDNFDDAKPEMLLEYINDAVPSLHGGVHASDRNSLKNNTEGLSGSACGKGDQISGAGIEAPSQRTGRSHYIYTKVDVPETVKEEPIEIEVVEDKKHYYVEQYEKPLSETELSIATALGSGESEDSVMVTYNVTRRKLHEMRKNTRFMEILKKANDSRIDFMISRNLGLTEKIMDVTARQVETLIAENTPASLDAARKMVLGRQSVLEATESLAKMKNQESESIDAKSFLAGLIAKSNEYKG